MKTHFLIMLGMYLAYIILKSWNDSIEEKKSHSSPNHSLEWWMTALFATACGYGLTFTLKGVFLFDLMMVPFTWVMMDMATNAFLKQNPITHIGSGYWDEFFKLHFKDEALKAIWVSKLILSLITCLLYLRYQIWS